MTQLTARTVRIKIRENLNSINKQSEVLKASLIEIYNADKENIAFHLEVNAHGLSFKSEPLKLFPLYEERIVFENGYPLWKGEFYFKNEENQRKTLVSFYLAESGNVAVNNTSDWDYDITGTEVFHAILDQLFESAVTHKLITP